jgi:hypothetical protein
MREDTVLYFETAPTDIDPLTVKHVDGIPDDPEFAPFDVICGSYQLGKSTPDMRDFFKGRPVHVYHSTWGGCGILKSTTTEEGAHSRQQAEIVEAAVSKLTPDELRAISWNGFKRYPESDPIRDYPRDYDHN